MGPAHLCRVEPLDLNLATIWRIVSEWRWLILGASRSRSPRASSSLCSTTPLYRARRSSRSTRRPSRCMDHGKAKADVGQRPRLPGHAIWPAAQPEPRRAGRPGAQSRLQPEFVAARGRPRHARRRIAAGHPDGQFRRSSRCQSSRLVKISFSSPSPALAAQITNSYRRQFHQLQPRAALRGVLLRPQLPPAPDRQGRRASSRSPSDGSSLMPSSRASSTPRPANGRVGNERRQTRSQGASLGRAQCGARRGDHASGSPPSSAIASRWTRRRPPRSPTAPSRHARPARGRLRRNIRRSSPPSRPDYPDMVRLRSRDRGARARDSGREAGTSPAAAATRSPPNIGAAAAEERPLQGQGQPAQGRSARPARPQRSSTTSCSARWTPTAALYDALLQRYKEIGVAGGIGTNTVSVVDRAEPPAAPIRRT